MLKDIKTVLAVTVAERKALCHRYPLVVFASPAYGIPMVHGWTMMATKKMVPQKQNLFRHHLS